MPTRKAKPAPLPHPGEQIRMARLKLRWSQADLAERLGIGQTAVSQLEAWRPDGWRPGLDWFAEHADVWAALGLGIELVRPLWPQDGVCPTCQRPL